MAWEEADLSKPIRVQTRSRSSYFYTFGALHVLLSVPFAIMQFIANWPGFKSSAVAYETPICEALEIAGGLLGKVTWLQVHYWIFYKFSYAGPATRFVMFALESALISLAIVAAMAWIGSWIASRLQTYMWTGCIVYMAVASANILLYYVVFVF